MTNEQLAMAQAIGYVEGTMAVKGDHQGFNLGVFNPNWSDFRLSGYGNKLVLYAVKRDQDGDFKECGSLVTIGLEEYALNHVVHLLTQAIGCKMVENRLDEE